MSSAARPAGEFRVPILFTGVFLFVLLRTAWLSDDSYIIFRTVDNFIHGWGLRWNVAERVQTFTDPLWTLTLAVFSSITREIYFTSLALSVAISAAAFFVVTSRLSASRASAALAACVLLLSRAFVDYSTSGLENPLTHLLSAFFLIVFLKADIRPKSVWLLSTIAFLSATNRPDTLLLFLPALAWAVSSDFSMRTLGAAILGALPFAAWEAFSVLYYGFPFPNTAYAKLHTGISSVDLARQGLIYFWQSLRADPITLIATAAGSAVAFFVARGRPRYAALGVLLYLAYVVRIGGDFMSGRFLTAPLFCSVVLLSAMPLSGRRSLLAAVILYALVVFHPSSLPLTGRDYGLDRNGLIDKHGISDERAFYYPATGLLRWTRSRPLPQDAMVDDGRKAALEKPPIALRMATGYFAYFAGPAVHVVDVWALGDALLARLPAASHTKWRIGHFTRDLPPGYLNTLASGENRIVDENLAAYFDKLSLILRGPLFDLGRLTEIVRMNLGKNDGLILAYSKHPRPRRLVVEEADLARARAEGTAWDDPANVVMGEPGVDVALKETSRDERVEISVDHNDAYDVFFMKGEAERGTVRTLPSISPPTGLKLATLKVPAEAVREGYDKIRILPIGGDGLYSLGHLRRMP